MFLAESNKRIYTGEDLKAMVSEAQGFKKRDCYSELQKYLNHPRTSMVFSFCGLKGTGKSTIMTQAICDMDPEHFKQTCFILGNKYESMDELASDMYRLYRGDNKYKYFFVYEITAIPDFIRRPAWMSDLFCKMGNRVVITGTDSLSLIMAGADHLYARLERVRMSYIPYYEFCRIIGDAAKDDEGNKGIDLYIRYGGALVPKSSDGNLNFSESPFAAAQTMGEYIDTAISNNIRHSLQQDDSIRYERSPLRELEKEGRLQGIISRVVALFNTHVILNHVLEAVSLPLPSMQPIYDLEDDDHPIKAVCSNQSDPINALSEPIKSVIKDYLSSLSIPENIGAGITDAQIRAIKYFFEEIGLLGKVQLVTSSIKKDLAGNIDVDYSHLTKSKDQLVLVQPGMQFCIANSLVNSMDKYAGEYDVKLSVLNKVRECILKDLVAIEAVDAVQKINAQNRGEYSSIWNVRIYKHQFNIRTVESINDNTKENSKVIDCVERMVDLLVEDSRRRRKYKFKLFSIRSSNEVDNSHYKDLVDPDIRWHIETYTGAPINLQYIVLYRGPSKVIDDAGKKVVYYNVEDFLCKMGEDPNFLVCNLEANVLKSLGQEMDDTEPELEEDIESYEYDEDEDEEDWLDH